MDGEISSVKTRISTTNPSFSQSINRKYSVEPTTLTTHPKKIK
jgi:hypothetical protein